MPWLRTGRCHGSVRAARAENELSLRPGDDKSVGVSRRVGCGVAPGRPVRDLRPRDASREVKVVPVGDAATAGADDAAVARGVLTVVCLELSDDAHHFTPGAR
jgi:hypothetical protein